MSCETSGHSEIFLKVYYFSATHVACEIVVPQLGIEPVFPAAETQSLKHWTSGEVSGHSEFLFA